MQIGDLQDLPLVPARLLSLDGQLIDTSGTLWRLRSSADGGTVLLIEWTKLDLHATFSRRARHLMKLYSADRILRKKGRTIENDFRMFLRFKVWLHSRRHAGFVWSDLTEGLARGFLDHGLRHTADKGNDFSRLRTFYEWGVAKGYDDFDLALHRILQSITAIGNSKGHHVRFRDSKKGPFSPDELLLIRNAIDARQGTNQDRALVMLHLELGHNPNATARLRNKDFIRYQTQSEVVYQLDVPRVKKRTTNRETKRRPISTKLGGLLEDLQTGVSDDLLFHWLSPIHPEASIYRAMERFSETARIMSPRTGKQLIMTPRRFRFSIATHMAEEGASIFHIAEVLDHTDTQNVRVYVETASSIADPVAAATDAVLGPLVRRFQGKIVTSRETAVFNGLPNQVIPAVVPHLGIAHLNVGGVGMCGRNVRKDGLCKLLPPLSCYLCPSFMALRDGPHREMLNCLDAFLRDNQDINDKRILMQLDDTRMAIRQVLDEVKPTKHKQ